MSFAVTQRTREMGVRSAWARRGAALDGDAPSASSCIGVVLGLVLAIVAGEPPAGPVSRRSRDVTVFAGVILMLVVVSLLASLLPARRVAKIDPVKALATE